MDTQKTKKIGVWVSGAEIQTSAVDTRTAVWVSTPEKFSKIVLGKTRNFSRKFRGVSAPALYKTRPLLEVPRCLPVDAVAVNFTGNGTEYSFLGASNWQGFLG